jgi:glyoxylase-like metal-dependent hydrolase (beta-lactamase superfamily II)
MMGWLLVMIVILLGVAWAQRPDGHLHVYFLETPGDAILVQAPSGRFVLIDGGGDPALLATLMGRIMPFWRRDLAAVVLTSADGAHLPGQAAALARYRPDVALAPPGLATRGTAGEWRRLVGLLQAQTRALRPGTRLDLGGGAGLRALAVAPGDQGGAVLLIEYGTTRAIIHGGGSLGDAAADKAAGKPLAALAYPWQRELDTALLADLRPKAIIFTSAYEAATPALLSYAERRDLSPSLYHEQNDGTVELISDGKRAWVETER